MVERSTDEFGRRCNGAASLIERDPEIDRVLSGQADRAGVAVGAVQLDVQAIRSADGVRHALLTVRGGDREVSSPSWDAEFDDSPAIVWLKDLDGRYTKVNPRHTELLPVAVCGVAAPLSAAHVARSECARLMRLERWSRRDPEVVRDELIQEWGAGPGPKRDGGLGQSWRGSGRSRPLRVRTCVRALE